MRSALIRRVAEGREVSLLCAGFGVALFLWWRLLGIPMPATLGRMLPAAWLLAALLAPRGKGPSPGVLLPLPLLSLCILTLWGSGRLVLLVGSAACLAGLAPVLLHTVRSRAGLLRALVPLAVPIVSLPLFSGDEPYNLAMAESLVRDGDLSIDNNLRQLDSHARVTPFYADLEGGVSHTQPLFPLLLLPGLPLGIPGVRAISLLIALMGAAVIGRMVRESGGGSSGQAWGLAALLLFPGISILGMAYPGWAATLLLAGGVWLGWQRRLSLPLLFVICVLMAALKIRFAPLALGLGLLWLLDRGSGRLRMLFACVGLLLLVLLVDRFLLGGRFVWARYLNAGTVRVIVYRTLDPRWLAWIALAPLGLILDAEQGLLFRAPWILLAPVGLFLQWRKDRRLALWLLVPAALYVLSIVVWLPREWHGAPTPAGRLLVPLVPLLIVTGARSLESGRGRALIALSVLISSLNLLFPGLRLNHADGSDVLVGMIEESTGLHYTRLLPSVVRPQASCLILWSVACAAALIAVCRKRRDLAALSLAGAALIGVGASARQTSLEAEDATGSQRFGGELFPASPDPFVRTLWFGSPERLLRLSDPLDRLILPQDMLAGGSGSLRVRAVSYSPDPDVRWGLSIDDGDSSRVVFFRSEPLPPPSWAVWVRAGRGDRRDLAGAYAGPGNLRDTLISLSFDPGAERLVISAVSDPGPGSRTGSPDPEEGIYLDRLDVR
ncbi:hypothetical protein JW921_04550 [Candidatus Fermentibacterales bacterium]|nr:hypothetical protein [Candidatus Fermentibacterales bacterium]